MARQQRFDWFLSHRRRRKSRRKQASCASGVRKIRQPNIEPLEIRYLLSVNCAKPTDVQELTGSSDLSTASSPTVVTSNFAVGIQAAAIAHDHNGDGITDHAPQDHDPGCCCEQCLGMTSVVSTHDHNGDGIPDHAAKDHDPGCCCEQCLGMTSVVSTHDHNGDGIPDHAAKDHDPGCCCEQCLGVQNVFHTHGHGHGVHSHPDGLWASAAEFEKYGEVEPEEFDARTAWSDLDPATDGIQITYSYSNLLDGGLPGGLTPEELIAATEEALGLWASVSPLQFIEIEDSGPDPGDSGYPAASHPLLRIGHHFIDGSSSVLAHAFFPNPNGVGGDVHFDNGDTWNINPSDPGFDVIEVMTHELGHALGLGHEFTLDAIMNPFYGGRYDGPGTGFLLDDDIAGIQALYGEGEGGVTPLAPLMVNVALDVDDTFIEVDIVTGAETLIDLTPDELSLREAIRFSSFSDGTRTIGFDESIIGSTIELDPSLGSLVIDTKMRIEGAGSEITILAPDESETEGDGLQIFDINNEDPMGEEPDTIAEVFISGLTLTGGDSATAGGAIFSSEDLTLEDMHIHDNFSAETGGGISATGPLSIARSTVENNTATDDGGGAYVSAGVNVDTSTFFNNQSGDEGGAIAAEGEGTELIVTTSTLSGNMAVGNGGGIHFVDENPTKFRVLHSTIFENDAGGTGGGVYIFDGVLALEHSIVARNTDNGTAPDLDNVNLFAIPSILARYSLVGDASGSQITQQDPNVLGVDPSVPLLEPLSDNGGPTRTHKPVEGSPVLNAGNPDIPTPTEFDQRGFGFKRIREGVIDIGAVEATGFGVGLPLFVNTLEDVVADDEFLSLREAIIQANDDLGPNEISFDVSLNGGTIGLNGSLGEMLITDTTIIDASSLSGGLTISGLTNDPTPTQNNGDGSRLLRIDDGNATEFVDVELIGLTLIGGDVTGDGGAIHSIENLTLRQVSVLDSFASSNGGGVYHRAGATGGTLLIDSSTLAGNEAGADGGGLWSNTNLPAEPDPDPDPNPIVGKVFNTTVSGNIAGDEGGGIINFDGQLELRHVTITENQADHGSGVVSFGDAFTKTLVYSSIISGNVVNENSPGTSVDDTGFDVQRSREVAFNSFESLGYNLIGIGDALLNFNNNDQTEITDPMLRPLGNFGGKTMTHALLPDSAAIDAGDPNAELPGGTPTGSSVVVTEYDQRGEPFSRIADADVDGTARIDIGSFEVPTPEPSADFDNDGDTDGADFLAWQRGFGKVDAQRSDGDSDFDEDVDGDDLGNWLNQFGSIDPASEIAPVLDAVPTVSKVAISNTERTVSITGSRTLGSNSTTTDLFALAAAHDYFLRDQGGRSDHADEGNDRSTSPVYKSLASQFERNGEILGFARRATVERDLPGKATEREVHQSVDAAFESLGLEHPFDQSEV